MGDRRFRFAVQAFQAPDGPAWTQLARQAEELGYSTLQVMDHFGDQLGPVPAMTAAAATTSELRVGSLVFDNDYRHPVVLAKDIATVDVLSGGRAEFGLGAGWMTSDYCESGIPHDPPGRRVDRLEEALAVFKGLWAPGPFTYDGDHYRITELDGKPDPVQRPHPPILLGGGGPRMLGICAREADIVGINPSMRAGRVTAETAQDTKAEAVDTKVEIVRQAAGDRFEQLELNVMAFGVVVTRDRQGKRETLAPMFGLSPDEVDATPYVLIGNPDEIADDLRSYRDRWGISYFTVMGDVMERFAPVVERLAGT